MPIKAASPAPAIKLPASDGKTYDLKDYAGKTSVVVFVYPKADTPGCTKEACGFRDAIASYKALGVPVFGLSPDPVDAVKNFAEKFQLNFPLLADADHSIIEKLGAWVQKERDGVKSMGAARTTFVIGKDGKISHVFENVNPEGHDREVMDWLKNNAA